MVHKITLDMPQDRHPTSSSNKLSGLLNGHGFGLFPTGRGAGYATVSHHGLEDDGFGYRSGGRRAKGRSLTGGGIKALSRPSRNALLVAIAIGLAFLLGRTIAPQSRTHHYPAPPFLIPASKFPPLTAEQETSLTPSCTDRSILPAPLQPSPGHVVPNVLHYVYGLKDSPTRDGKGPEFPYYAYLAIRSALLNIAPQKTYFHYHNIPTGPWWDALLPHLTLIHHPQIPTHIMGKPLNHFAHKSDVIRLEVLLHSGGIYLDIDTFVTRPFEPLMYHPTTLGMEASPDSRRTALEPEGLCNAVIIAQNGSEFIRRWRGMYETFDQDIWAGHSVVMPWNLARKYPAEVQVLSTRSFFWPMWSGDEIQKVHESTAYDFAASGQFGYHAWESLAMRYLGDLSPRRIREVDSSFNRMVRPYIGEEDDAIYEAWKGAE